MTSNSYQIIKWWKLKKHLVITDKTLDFDSFNRTNFKLYKLYHFLKQKPTLSSKIKEKVFFLMNNTTFFFKGIKLYYNLKFDVFWVVKTEEFVVILNKTIVFTNSNPLEFDYNLIRGVR